MGDKRLVPLFEKTWQSIADLAADFGDAEWKASTELPGWNVKDCMVHMIGTESILLGRSAPTVQLEPGDHVKNAIGEANEVWIESRRDVAAADILAEFREITAARLDALNAMTAEDFEKDSWTPRGPGKYGDFMEVRVFDCWMHEQDIRRALNRPGHLDGAVVEQALDEVQRALPYVVGKKATAPQGATVVFEITGPVKRTIPVGVEGRASILDEAPGEPDVRITADMEAFCAVCGGRWEAATALADGRIRIEGDETLGRRIVDNLNFVV